MIANASHVRRRACRVCLPGNLDFLGLKPNRLA
jgi:hypothetical protein